MTASSSTHKAPIMAKRMRPCYPVQRSPSRSYASSLCSWRFCSWTCWWVEPARGLGRRNCTEFSYDVRSVPAVALTQSHLRILRIKNKLHAKISWKRCVPHTKKRDSSQHFSNKTRRKRSRNTREFVKGKRAHRCMRRTFYFADSLWQRCFNLKCTIRFFSLVRVSKFSYANFPPTCVRCTHLLQSERDCCFTLSFYAQIWESCFNIWFLFNQVGLAVGDIDTIQKNATMERLAMQVDIVNAFDERYPMRWARWLKRTSLVVKPNQKTSFNM